MNPKNKVDSIKNKVFMTNLGERGQVIDGAEIERSQDGLLKAVVRCKLVRGCPRSRFKR